MKNENYIEYLVSKIHTVIMATNDDNGFPVTCAVDIMLYEDSKLYFLTARGKSLYKRLKKHKYVALTGINGNDTMSSVAISLRGKVRGIGSKKLSDIFEKNTYMKEIYPDGKGQDILEVFEIHQFSGEYFDLSQKPIYRKSFSNNQTKRDSGYYINSKCKECNICVDVCPQKCIDTNRIHFEIKLDHCLRCGKCKEVCPWEAVELVD